MTRSIRALALLSMVLLPGALAAQDTLSDSAWKADIARRAALRKQQSLKRDSLVQLVDTIVITPLEVELHVGDTITFSQLTQRLTVVGKRRSGEVIAGFGPTYFIALGSRALETRQGQILALSPGVALLYARATKPASFTDDSPPTTKVRIIVH